MLVSAQVHGLLYSLALLRGCLLKLVAVAIMLLLAFINYGEKMYKKNRPGKLHAEHYLTIETRMAQQMYSGRERSKDKEHITGFVQFGKLMSSLYLRASNDDPYFDKWLIEIEKLMEETREKLEGIKAKLETLVQGNSKLEIQVPESVSPVKVPMSYRNPYAYKAADLIMLFDEICKYLNAARHTARITTRQFHQISQNASASIRSLFERPLRFPQKGMIISREEYRQKSRKALEVIEKYGALDEDIISGERRGDYAPNIRKITMVQTAKKDRS